VFELNEGSHHDHLVCVTCGRVEEFSTPKSRSARIKVAKERGFVIRDHSLQL